MSSRKTSKSKSKKYQKYTPKIFTTQYDAKPDVNTCRLCGKKGEYFVPIFSGSDNIVEKITECLHLMVLSIDMLPLHICSACLRRLNQSYKFLKTVLKVDDQLKEEYLKSLQQTDKTELNSWRNLAENGPFDCDVCGKNFTDMNLFDNHIDFGSCSPLYCYHCDQIYENYEQLLFHNLEEHEENEISQNMCSPESSNLLQQKAEEISQKSKIPIKWNCEICSFTFNSHLELLMHEHVADSVELSRVEEVESTGVEEMESTKVEEIEPAKEEEMERDEEEEMELVGVEEMESTKVEEIEPSKEEGMERDEQKEMEPANEEDMGPVKEEEMESAKEEEMEPAKVEEMEPAKVDEMELGRVVEMETTNVDEVVEELEVMSAVEVKEDTKENCGDEEKKEESNQEEIITKDPLMTGDENIFENSCSNKRKFESDVDLNDRDDEQKLKTDLSDKKICKLNGKTNNSLSESSCSETQDDSLTKKNDDPPDSQIPEENKVLNGNNSLIHGPDNCDPNNDCFKMSDRNDRKVFFVKLNKNIKQEKYSLGEYLKKKKMRIK